MSNQNHGSGERRGSSDDRDGNPQPVGETGRKGGQQTQSGSSSHEKSTGQHGGSEHRSGQHSQNTESQKGGSQKTGVDSDHGGKGNFANEPEDARDAGPKGGQSSHRGASK